jgi:hypothetical protein
VQIATSVENATGEPRMIILSTTEIKVSGGFVQDRMRCYLLEVARVTDIAFSGASQPEEIVSM